MQQTYQPSWNSLKQHSTPQWFKDAKFGIYTHWGVYSVPAHGPNATWYPYNMYRQGTDQYNFHEKTFGHPSKFGYKDFIPMFTGDKFDADEWAELFHKAGAQFAGPVGEHHDGFCMWDTHYSEWNAARMGPHCDLVGELARAIRKQEMKFMVALHHAENWWFYPHWLKDYDTTDPRYTGLYGPLHNLEGQSSQESWFFNQEPPSHEFLERWLAKTKEVIDRYQPDMLWFDFGLGAVPEAYKMNMLAHYFNQADEWDKEVVLTYKTHDLPAGCGVVDIELGGLGELAYQVWLTDTTVDDGEGWGYLQETNYKSVSRLVHYLVDNVSKNGNLLLNVGPQPNGEIPEQARDLLIGIGKWLAVNGEAIYATTPWITYGEGPTQQIKAGGFSERANAIYTAQDVRYTVKDNYLYAICLGLPTEPVTILKPLLKSGMLPFYASEIRSVTMLGSDDKLTWTYSPAGLTIESPERLSCEHAVAFKIERRDPFKE
jgi:alpha-L-fucosidase